MFKQKFQFGSILLAVTAAAMLVIVPAHAVDFKISGQINRAVMFADNGDQSDWFFVDNDNSSTRFRFTGSNDFEYNFTVGILWEVEMQSNPSNEADFGDVGDSSDVTFNERKIEFWVNHTFGKLWMGQGDMASNNTSEVDLSGTDVVTYSSVGDMGGGLSFVDDDGNPITTVDDTRSNFDGLSRKDRVRYDTPKFGPVYFSGSIKQDSTWDASGWYAADLGGFGKLAAAVAWANAPITQGYNNFSSSASWLHPSGFNLTGSYAKRFFDESGKDDAWNAFGKVGFTRGIHAISVQYSFTKDLQENGDKAPTWGAGYVISPWESVQFYAGWYNYALKRDGIKDPDNINAVMVGGRVKF